MPVLLVKAASLRQRLGYGPGSWHGAWAGLGVGGWGRGRGWGWLWDYGWGWGRVWAEVGVAVRLGLGQGLEVALRSVPRRLKISFELDQ